MKKQAGNFLGEVLIAFIVLFAITVIGVLAAGCAVKKKQDTAKYVESLHVTKFVDGEPFLPVTEHSEISGETTISAGAGISISSTDYLYVECPHIWVQTFADTSYIEDRTKAHSILDDMTYPIGIIPFYLNYDKDWDEYKEGISLVCFRCQIQKRQVIHTKHFKTEGLSPNPIFPRDVETVQTMWKECESDCYDTCEHEWIGSCFNNSYNFLCTKCMSTK